jgi:uncharacterized protein YdhG (YjbR/CyaY superfamily)
MEESRKFTSIDKYIATFPAPVQERLQQVRAAIHAAAPDATEKISYQMPTFFLNGNLIHFAAFKEHIGIYPMPGVIAAFHKELEGYETSKGAIRFPLSQPLPLELLEKIVKYRIEENRRKVEAKKGTKKK